MTNVVSCQSISKSFDHKSHRVNAIDNVSIELNSGDFVAIRGKSGCGKSTFMLCLGGLQKPDSGSVLIAGQSLYSLTADQRAAFRAKNIGYVFQQFHLIPYLSVMENVLAAQLGLRSNKNSKAVESAQRLIDRIGLSDRADHKPSELSIGECQRVAIARSLMNGPQLILADEPTGNLDEENTDIVLGALREIANDGTAVLLVTHDAQCKSFVDKVVQMQAGKIVETSATVN